MPGWLHGGRRGCRGRRQPATLGRGADARLVVAANSGTDYGAGRSFAGAGECAIAYGALSEDETDTLARYDAGAVRGGLCGDGPRTRLDEPGISSEPTSR